jgi:polyhydroxyalkanoate synthesis regulator protein
MTPTGNPGKIKRYANRLYHTGTARYVSLDDLAGMADDEEDFVVYEATPLKTLGVSCSDKSSCSV